MYDDRYYCSKAGNGQKVLSINCCSLADIPVCEAMLFQFLAILGKRQPGLFGLYLEQFLLKGTAPKLHGFPFHFSFFSFATAGSKSKIVMTMTHLELRTLFQIRGYFVGK